MKRSEHVGELVAALAKAQLEFTPAMKESKNPYYQSKYADLASNIGAVRPALNKHGIALVQDISADLDRQVAIVKTGLYLGEQFMEIEIEAPAKGQSKKDEQSGVAGTKFDVQTIGAATLYLRRYSIAAICGIAAEDDEEDDGNSLDNDNKSIKPKMVCPDCGKDAIIKGKEEYGGGWLCYKAKGGCGSKFAEFPPNPPGSEISHPKNTQGATAAKQTAQPSTQRPAERQQASQPQARPTKRIPPSPPEMLPGLMVFIKEVRFHAKKGATNAHQSVFFESPSTGKNQMHPWKCDYAICWHESLFDVLDASVGKECDLLISECDKKINVSDEWPTHFIYIEDVVSAADPATGDFTEYFKGKPVIEGEAQ